MTRSETGGSFYFRGLKLTWAIYKKIPPMLATLQRKPTMCRMSARVQSLVDFGTTGLVIDIECHLSNNLPNIVIVGFGNRAVDESKERIRGAFSSSNLQIPRKRITINLAPADIPKDSSSFDLAIAASILCASGQITKVFTNKEAVMGELGLDGAIRPVRGIIGKILAGRSHGITTFFIPAANLGQAQLIPGITIYPLVHLQDIYFYLTSGSELTKIETGAGLVTPASRTDKDYELGLSDIVGQPLAKRALEIAAAGGHNVLLNGPPGTGKSMLARALPSLLPPLSSEETLEITHLHSLAGKEYDSVVAIRPFRSPHHSASHVAVVGGGHSLRPGEISLAHRGILFFDELPEFSRATIEALRQPLEDRIITIARAKDTMEYPANFILIATANPCPCGYYGTTKACDCPAHLIQKYRAKLSGPIMDRIDLYSDVHEVEHDKLLTTHHSAADDAVVRSRVAQARIVQANRYKGSGLNATMNNRDIKTHAKLTPEAKELIDSAAQSLDISARSYMRTIKVARTIADLDESPVIEPSHITEALQYRSRAVQTAL